MIRIIAVWLFMGLGCSLWSQFINQDYPDWFLEPPEGDLVVGIARNVSKRSVTLKEAGIDAMSMYELSREGVIRTNIISHKNRLADSLMLKLGDDIEFAQAIHLVKDTTVGNMFIAQFKITDERRSLNSTSIDESNEYKKVAAIGIQTIHPDRVCWSWQSAEIEALKELSFIKEAKVRSIYKSSKSRIEELIFIQSETQFNNVRVERRWVENNVAHVQVSDIY